MRKGEKMTEEARLKMSLACKGRVPWNKGKVCSPLCLETRQKISHAMKGRKHCIEAKQKISQGNKGKKRTEEHKLKHSLTMKGHVAWNKGIPMKEEQKVKLRKPKTEEHKLKQSLAMKGKMPSEETRKKLSIARQGEKNNQWRGGLSYEKYTPIWTKELRIYIRERDNYLCRVCLKKQDNQAHHVHHIDYEKKNCNPINLITLCLNCHMKTNANREYWQKRLQMMMALDNGYVCDCDTTKTTEEQNNGRT